VRAKDGSIEQRLVKIDRAVLRIPNLAIHLTTAKEREAFDFNKEDHLVPILSLAVKKSLEGSESVSETKSGGEEQASQNGWTEFQEPLLLKLLSSELDINVDDILDFELNLFDIQKASFGGIYSEFVHSARLDNLASCFMAIQGLVEYTNEEGRLENDEDISLVALFDHEEIGSDSATGAGSPIMGEAVERICNAFSNDDKDDVYSRAISKSFVLSVDQAHAIHPNYAGKHEKGHAPRMNDGMVIKRNSSQRYATTGVTGLIVREIAKKAGLKPIQEFVVRNDCGCGSTIGPIISASTGIRAIDMGCPQLSMHSIRESMGTSDFSHGLELFKGFFQYFREVDDSFVDKN
jgi:aspartyl aminopeptidase